MKIGSKCLGKLAFCHLHNAPGCSKANIERVNIIKKLSNFSHLDAKRGRLLLGVKSIMVKSGDFALCGAKAGHVHIFQMNQAHCLHFKMLLIFNNYSINDLAGFK